MYVSRSHPQPLQGDHCEVSVVAAEFGAMPVTILGQYVEKEGR